MLLNYLKTALRNLYRNKLYSIINISGLSVGLVSCILLTFYIQFELSFDKHFPNSERIYRLVIDLDANDWAISAFPIGHLIDEQFPQVEKFTRLKPQNEFISIESENDFFSEQIFFADSTIFKFFDFQFIRGNPNNIFFDDNSVVLTRSKAIELYGAEDPIGKTIKRQGINRALIVKGIIEDAKINSHFHPKIIASSNLFKPMRSDFERPWSFLTNHYTYFLISKGSDKASLEKEINTYISDYHEVPEEERIDNLHLQSLESIHLNSDRGLEIESNGSKKDIYIFSTIAIFILIIASINFMNLSTAQSLKRAKEVGIRKTIGGNKAQLIIQFLGESLIITFIALIISLLILMAIIPEFNDITSKGLSIDPFENNIVVPVFVGLALVVGLFSGMYPAFVLSSFSPMKVLKGSSYGKVSGQSVRKVLVVIQFGIAFIILVGTFVVNGQLDYMLNKDLGFKKENLLILNLPPDSIGERNMKTEMLRIPEVVNVTRFIEKPGFMVRTTTFWHEGAPNDDGINTYAFSGDSDFDEALDLEILRGQYFDENSQNSVEEFVINEAAAKSYGWNIDSVVGKRMEFGNRSENSGIVIGLVKDFHFKHLQEEIEPLVFHKSRGYEGRFMALKLETENLNSSMEKVESVWSKFSNEIPFNYSFMDQDFDKLFQKEKDLSALFAIFSGLAVFVSCLGLFGLASFSIEQKRKSLAIHKVLGASFSNILKLFSKEFLILVGLGIVLGIPFSWYIMNEWLNVFAYRIELGPGIFVYSVITASAIALLIISFHSLKAVTENPVNSLKDE